MNDDGYIKFKCNWQKLDCISEDEIKDLVQWRNILRQLNLIGMNPSGIAFGNISKRTIGNEFIISGSKTSAINKVDKTHFSKVISRSYEKNQINCMGLSPASSESLTHSAIYDSDKNVNAVVHTHNNKLWNELRHKLPATPEYAEFGTTELAGEIIKIFENKIVFNKKIIILAGHKDGIISFGSNLKQAVSELIDLI